MAAFVCFQRRTHSSLRRPLSPRPVAKCLGQGARRPTPHTHWALLPKSLQALWSQGARTQRPPPPPWGGGAEALLWGPSVQSADLSAPGRSMGAACWGPAAGKAWSWTGLQRLASQRGPASLPGPLWADVCSRWSFGVRAGRQGGRRPAVWGWVWGERRGEQAAVPAGRGAPVYTAPPAPGGATQAQHVRPGRPPPAESLRASPGRVEPAEEETLWDHRHGLCPPPPWQGLALLPPLWGVCQASLLELPRLFSPNT